MFSLFTTFVYQPFFNILVFFYWLLDVITQGNPDMGIAVILLTLLIRVLMLPLSLASLHREKDRRDIAEQIKAIEETHADQPAVVTSKRKNILKSNSRVLISEIIGLFVQIVIALMLWRMFNTGLTGEDLNLTYGFMPEVTTPFNLVFLGDFDLSQYSFRLNLLLTVLLIIVEILSAMISPYTMTRNQMVKVQFVLPVISFLLFWALQLPAGKKLFIITTLCFSIVLISIRGIQQKFQDYKLKKELEQTAGEKVVVDVK